MATSIHHTEILKIFCAQFSILSQNLEHCLFGAFSKLSTRIYNPGLRFGCSLFVCEDPKKRRQKNENVMISSEVLHQQRYKGSNWTNMGLFPLFCFFLSVERWLRGLEDAWDTDFCLFLRRWRGWSRLQIPAVPQSGSVRSFSTAPTCSPASCPTSSRTPTGEASSGPPCREPAEPGYGADILSPPGGQEVFCSFCSLWCWWT